MRYSFHRTDRSLRRDAIRSAIEGLEARKLLANDPLTIGNFSIGTSVWLNVTGTVNDDTIVVTRNTTTGYRISNGTWSLNRTGTFAGVRVVAGAGADSVSTAGAVAFRLIAYGDAGNDSLTGGSLADSLFGGADNDSLSGGSGNDTVRGENGNDTHLGGIGNDNMLGGAGDDLLAGGDGNDSLGGDAGADTVQGDAGNDTLMGGTENDSLTGGAGADSLKGDAGADSLNGEADNDILLGGTEADLLNGDAGNDTLNGEAGGDTLNGSAGNDCLNGGLDNDSVDGGEGNDKVMGDAGTDVYVDGSGTDSLDYTGRTVTLTLSLDGQANDGATGEADNIPDTFEVLIGGNLADTITGNGSANTLNGGAGNDTINGLGGNDKLYGGAGLDSLSGGDGDDSVWGQADNDRLFGADGEDLLEGGAGNDQSDGGAGRDRLISLGGGIYDSLTGGDGLDSFWLDRDATERTLDVSAEETTAKAVHRVGSFVNYGTTVISKEITGQKFAEPRLPTGVTGKVSSFAGNKLFASGGPSADDIEQGQVGDCWYLCTLAAVADVNPEVIRQSITDLGDGTYAVRFYHASTRAEQYVRVDADLYTYSWSSTLPLMVNTGAEGSIWAPLMEKALTWVRGSSLGSYATIEAGWMNEAFTRLGMTSTVAWRGSLGSASQMLDWINNQFSAGKAVTVGFNAVSGANLVANHAYTVDRVNDNGDGTYSVTLRNPWGVDGNSSTDGSNDGYVTLTTTQLFANYTGLMAA